MAVPLWDEFLDGMDGRCGHGLKSSSPGAFGMFDMLHITLHGSLIHDSFSRVD